MRQYSRKGILTRKPLTYLFFGDIESGGQHAVITAFPLHICTASETHDNKIILQAACLDTHRESLCSKLLMGDGKFDAIPETSTSDIKDVWRYWAVRVEQARTEEREQTFALSQVVREEVLFLYNTLDSERGRARQRMCLENTTSGV